MFPIAFLIADNDGDPVGPCTLKYGTPTVLGSVRIEPTVGLPPLYSAASYPLFGVDVKKIVCPDRDSQVIAVLPGHHHAVAIPS